MGSLSVSDSCGSVTGLPALSRTVPQCDEVGQMIAHIHNLVEREDIDDPLEAVKRGATERVVPIFMTALAAGLALIPLALAIGQPGSEIQAPMAIVILFGLLTSTALNMIVVPALYLRFGNIGRRRRENPSPEATAGVVRAERL